MFTRVDPELEGISNTLGGGKARKLCQRRESHAPALSTHWRSHPRVSCQSTFSAFTGPAHLELEGGEALNADPWLRDRLHFLRRCRQDSAAFFDDHRTVVGAVFLCPLLCLVVATPELWCVEPRVLGGFRAEVR